MLTAMNADMCSKCLVTEPVVKSFISSWQLDVEPRTFGVCPRIKPLIVHFWQSAINELTTEITEHREKKQIVSVFVISVSTVVNINRILPANVSNGNKIVTILCSEEMTFRVMRLSGKTKGHLCKSPTQDFADSPLTAAQSALR